LDKIPTPKVDLEAPFQMLVTNLGYDETAGLLLQGAYMPVN
jgi:GTP-binding protein